VNEMMDSLDKSHLRPLQGRMHNCAAECCKDKISSMETVQKCMENCSRPLLKVQTIIEQEMNDFQDRLTRCAQSCQDSVRDSVGSSDTEKEIPRFQANLEKCIVKCADDHMTYIPKMLSRLQSAISKEK